MLKFTYLDHPHNPQGSGMKLRGKNGRFQVIPRWMYPIDWSNVIITMVVIDIAIIIGMYIGMTML
jgi:hypothetical protein